MSERKETRQYDAGLKGVNVTLTDVQVNHCPNCGEETIGIKNILGLHREIVRHLALKKSKLTPKEISFLRHYLGFSISELARKMGVTRVAASRWESTENHLSMKSTSERLLRLMAVHDEPSILPLERMAELGVGEPRPLRLKMERHGGVWHETA